MARRAILGLDNLFTTSGLATVTASSEETAMPDDNLLDPRPSLPWRTTKIAPTNTIVRMKPLAAFGSGDLFGLIRTNLSRDRGLYRVLLHTTAYPHTYEEMVPTGIGASHSVSAGLYTDIDEGFSGAEDGNQITLVPPADTVHLTFNTPSASPDTGAHKQTFAIELEWGAGQAAPYTNYFKCYLYESGVEVKFLGYKEVPGYDVIGTGVPFTLMWTWDASDLGTASGANVELLFEWPGAGTLYVNRASWFCDKGMGTPQYDTGWLQAWPTLGGDLFPGVRATEAGLKPNCVLSTTTPYGKPYQVNALGQITFMLNDDQLPAYFGPVGDLEGFPWDGRHRPRYPDGYVQAGTGWFGHGLELAHGCSLGPAIRFIDPSLRERTIGGQLLVERRPKRRAVYLDANALLEDEFAGIADKLDFVKGTTEPVLVLPDPDNSTPSQLMNLYATLEDMDEFVRIDGKGWTDGKRLYRRSMVFEEFL